MGSVFSPYYRRALERAWRRQAAAPTTAAARDGDLRGSTDPDVDPEDHCAINVALYRIGGRSHWTMTERSRRHVRRDLRTFEVGPSGLRWDGDALTLSIDEVGAPIPSRVRGRVVVRPKGLCCWTTALDDGARHRWGPIAPCARVEVDLQRPSMRWSGHGYLDSNEGDEPIDRPFEEWDWSRAGLRDGSTGVIYDVRQKRGEDRVVACRFTPQGDAHPFEPPGRRALPPSRWRIARTMRSEPAHPPHVVQTLEDTPFYARSLIESGLLGERVTAMHETLYVPRLVSPVVQRMLPFRMPRRR